MRCRICAILFPIIRTNSSYHFICQTGYEYLYLPPSPFNMTSESEMILALVFQKEQDTEILNCKLVYLFELLSNG